MPTVRTFLSRFTRRYAAPGEDFASKSSPLYDVTVTDGGDSGKEPDAATAPTETPKLLTSLIFVDGTHVDHRCEEAFGRKDIDFDRFFRKLTPGTQVLGVIYCTAPYLFQDLRKHQQA